MGTVQVAVALLPDERTDGFVRCLALGATNNRLQLGLQNADGGLPPHPHISLFHCVINEGSLDGLATAVFNRTPRPDNRTFTCGELHTNSGGWMFLETPQTEWLLRSQRHVARKCNLFRVGPVPCSWQDHFTDAQRRAYETWGYPNVGEAWQPHFTYGMRGSSAEQHVPVAWTWRVRSVVIGRLGKFGTVTEVLKQKMF